MIYFWPAMMTRAMFIALWSAHWCRWCEERWEVMVEITSWTSPHNHHNTMQDQSHGWNHQVQANWSQKLQVLLATVWGEGLAGLAGCRFCDRPAKRKCHLVSPRNQDGNLAIFLIPWLAWWIGLLFAGVMSGSIGSSLISRCSLQMLRFSDRFLPQSLCFPLILYLVTIN